MIPNLQNEKAVLAALTATFRNLPPGLKDSIEPQWKRGAANQPEWVSRPQKGPHHHRIRLMPPGRPRRPLDFWDGIICFYELGIGTYGGRTGSQVQFLMGGNQEKCGGGRHNRAVDAILRGAAAERSDFGYKPISAEPYASFVKSSPSIDPEQMGRDMAWLIAETLPAFLGLPDSGDAR
jgi:hypothetical protein